mmetsp:Transcript_6891/g.26612  ORF Transcript_6891/g.26612 Transcript_6891/m.26612 type:complete len:216 (-) Transcript_6891:286-933(-)
MGRHPGVHVKGGRRHWAPCGQLRRLPHPRRGHSTMGNRERQSVRGGRVGAARGQPRHPHPQRVSAGSAVDDGARRCALSAAKGVAPGHDGEQHDCLHLQRRLPQSENHRLRGLVAGGHVRTFRPTGRSGAFRDSQRCRAGECLHILHILHIIHVLPVLHVLHVLRLCNLAGPHRGRGTADLEGPGGRPRRRRSRSTVVREDRDSARARPCGTPFR